MSAASQNTHSQRLKAPLSKESFQTGTTSTATNETTSGEPPAPPAQPVDGGFHGWLRVLGAHLLYISSWGLLNAYGAYVQYYESDLLRGRSSSDIAWPGTLQAVLIISVGVFTGPLFDRGYLAPLIIVGCFLVVFGMMMLSISTQYWQIVLSQGICVGLGSGIMFVPSLTLVSISFQKRRALAIAIATCGAAVGGVVFPIVLQQLLPKIGFAWSTRVLGFIAMACCFVGGGISLSGRHLIKPKPPRTLIDWESFTDAIYVIFSVAIFFVYLAYFIPIFYISEYVIVKLGGSAEWGIYTLVILNAATLIGRLGASWTAQTFGPIETLLGAVVINIVLLFAWFGVTTTAGMDVWAVVFGIVAGPLVTMPASVLPIITPDMGKLGTRMGMTWLCGALGGLVGSPVAGALIHIDSADFRGAQGFAGAVMAVGALCLVPVLLFTLAKTKAQPPAK